MKRILKLLPVLLVTASCLTSDTTLSSKLEASPMVWNSAKRLSLNSVSFASGTRRPRYSAFPNLATTACIRRKE